MRTMVAIAVFSIAGCGGSTSSTVEPTTPAAETGLPAPIEVCFRRDDGSLSAETAAPGRAGTYDPSLPIVPNELNWFVAEGPCVQYPGDSVVRERCGTRTAEAPVVTRVLCQQ